jgi:hypothetical protein
VPTSYPAKQPRVSQHQISCHDEAEIHGKPTEANSPDLKIGKAQSKARLKGKMKAKIVFMVDLQKKIV